MGLKAPKRGRPPLLPPHSQVWKGTLVWPQRARTAVAIMPQNFPSFGGQ